MHAGQQQGEFLAAVAGQQFALRIVLLVQALGDALELDVAFEMAVGVVVGLEVVHVDHQHRELAALVEAAEPFAAQAVFERAAVGDAGQGVFGHQFGELAVHLFQLAGAFGDAGFQPAVGGQVAVGALAHRPQGDRDRGAGERQQAQGHQPPLFVPARLHLEAVADRRRLAAVAGARLHLQHVVARGQGADEQVAVGPVAPFRRHAVQQVAELGAAFHADHAEAQVQAVARRHLHGRVGAAGRQAQQVALGIARDDAFHAQAQRLRRHRTFVRVVLQQAAPGGDAQHAVAADAQVGITGCRLGARVQRLPFGVGRDPAPELAGGVGEVAERRRVHHQFVRTVDQGEGRALVGHEPLALEAIAGVAADGVDAAVELVDAGAGGRIHRQAAVVGKNLAGGHAAGGQVQRPVLQGAAGVAEPQVAGRGFFESVDADAVERDFLVQVPAAVPVFDQQQLGGGDRVDQAGHVGRGLHGVNAVVGVEVEVAWFGGARVEHLQALAQADQQAGVVRMQGITLVFGPTQRPMMGVAVRVDGQARDAAAAGQPQGAFVPLEIVRVARQPLHFAQEGPGRGQRHPHQFAFGRRPKPALAVQPQGLDAEGAQVDAFAQVELGADTIELAVVRADDQAAVAQGLHHIAAFAGEQTAGRSGQQADAGGVGAVEPLVADQQLPVGMRHQSGQGLVGEHFATGHEFETAVDEAAQALAVHTHVQLVADGIKTAHVFRQRPAFRRRVVVGQEVQRGFGAEINALGGRHDFPDDADMALAVAQPRTREQLLERQTPVFAAHQAAEGVVTADINMTVGAGGERPCRRSAGQRDHHPVDAVVAQHALDVADVHLAVDAGGDGEITRRRLGFFVGKMPQQRRAGHRLGECGRRGETEGGQQAEHEQAVQEHLRIIP